MKHAVFFWQSMLPPHWQRGHRRYSRQVPQHLRAGLQQRRITAKLVEYKTFDEFFLCRIKQGPRAVKVCKGAASINVSHQQTRCICVLRDAHVDDVAVL